MLIISAAGSIRIPKYDHLLRLVEICGMAVLVDITGKVPGSRPVPRLPSNENELERGRLQDRDADVHISEDDGKNIRVDLRVRAASIDQVGLDVSVPEETVVRLCNVSRNSVMSSGALGQRTRCHNGSEVSIWAWRC